MQKNLHIQEQLADANAAVILAQTTMSEADRKKRSVQLNSDGAFLAANIKFLPFDDIEEIVKLVAENELKNDS